MDRVVDVWQVGLSWTLSDSSELVVHGAVAKAHPSLVGTKIWHWDATQVSANGGAHKYAGVTGIGQTSLGDLIELSSKWQSVCLLNLRDRKTSDEDNFTVPSSLQDLTWWQLRDVQLLVRISNISISGDHLIVNDAKNTLDTEAVEGKNEALEHVELGSLDLVSSVFLIPNSVFIEPVIWLGLGIEWVTKVGWPGGSNPVHWLVSAKNVVDELLALSISVILQNSEVSGRCAYSRVSLSTLDELACNE